MEAQIEVQIKELQDRMNEVETTLKSLTGVVKEWSENLKMMTTDYISFKDESFKYFGQTNKLIKDIVDSLAK